MDIVKCGKKGQVTIPRAVLNRLGIVENTPMLLDVTDDGAIVLRQAAVLPVEIYSDARIAEFEREDRRDRGFQTWQRQSTAFPRKRLARSRRRARCSAVQSPLQRSDVAMEPMLSSEVLSAANRSVLCWLATVDAHGRPKVSSKEIFAAIDAEHLVIANIESPTSVRSIAAGAPVCVGFIDVFVQKGFEVFGAARNVRRQDADFPRWSAPLAAMAGPRFPIDPACHHRRAGAPDRR
jgi:AbrB family looped-hinge helix DNA binding protein